MRNKESTQFLLKKTPGSGRSASSIVGRVSVRMKYQMKKFILFFKAYLFAFLPVLVNTIFSSQ
jgi:hypothetical protein